MSASRGALRVPANEMVEILVYLAEHNKIYGGTAKLTLAGWDQEVCKTIAADPASPKEVLNYWLVPANIRPVLFPILIENRSVLNSKLSELASVLKGEFIDVMIASLRVRSSPQLLQELSSNHALSGAQAARVQALIAGEAEAIEPKKEAGETGRNAEAHENADSSASPADALELEPKLEAADPETDNALVTFFAEHAVEIAAEGEKPFQPIGGIYEEMPVKEEPKAAAAAASAIPGPASQPAGAKHAVHKKLVNPQDEQRGSVLQKIARLDIKGRIQLAMKGTKEERSLLIRDGTKIVALAVLDSPKITDGEVEKFATQKNVLEAVLRAIPMKRRFAKHYAIVRNLVFNPRTPLDVSLGLMKNMLTADLRNLSGNKEVAETVRKLALRMFKQKSEKKD
ncbi:MAG TPA: hypothetical protein VGU90_01005 [Terriglobales bacterium]|nr:hypothetical protein [Terriglobales bacterium]